MDWIATPLWRAMVRVWDTIEVYYSNRNGSLASANTRMPGPRNSRRQKKPKAAKEKRRKETVAITTPNIVGNAALPDPGPDVGEKNVVDRTEEGSGGLEETLLREPPVYDAGTGPRVKSMGEFLRSSFASEPTWDDELCAEFAQEEMLEMLREVLPEEMALVCCWIIRSV